MGAEQHRPAALLVRRKLLLIGCWVCLSDGALLAAAAAAGAENTHRTTSSFNYGLSTHRPRGSNGGVVQFDPHCCRSFRSLCVSACESLLLSLASSSTVIGDTARKSRDISFKIKDVTEVAYA